jgi:hypothetical protein
MKSLIFFIENYILFKMTCQLINLIDNLRMRILLASRNCATVVRDVRVTGTIGMLIKKNQRIKQAQTILVEL